MQHSFRRTARALALAALVAAVPATAQASSILYQQVVNFPTASSFRTSYADPSQAYFRVFDNFTLGTPGVVTDVTWYGSWIDFTTTPSTNAASNTSSFQLGFWADSAGTPAGALSLQTFAIGSVNVTFLGQTSAGFDVYQYHVALTTPFQAQSGTQYWLSVFSNSTSFTPLWGWRAGSGGDDLTFQQNFSTGGTTLLGPDRAFTLEGNPVPEPGSVVLLISGLTAMALLRRRQKS